jgi:hypothetical protein
VLNSQPIGVNGYPVWFGLTHDNMSPAWSWVFTIVVTGGYLLYTVVKSLRAQAKGMAADTLQLVLARGLLIVAVGVVVTALANRNRNTNPFLVINGLPWALTIPIILMIVCTIVLNWTTWVGTCSPPEAMPKPPGALGSTSGTSGSRRSRSVPRSARWAGSSSRRPPAAPSSTSGRATSCSSRSRPPSSVGRRCSAAAAGRWPPSSAPW